MSRFEHQVKMPSPSKDIQWKKLLGDAIKTEYRCAECTRPIETVGFCLRCTPFVNDLNKKKFTK